MTAIAMAFLSRHDLWPSPKPSFRAMFRYRAMAPWREAEWTNVFPVETLPPLCGGCRDLGSCRLGIANLQVGPDGAARASLHCAAREQAGPGVAHGGWTAAVLDDALGRTLRQLGHGVVTKTITVDYLRPVPVEIPLLLEVATGAPDGRFWTMEGRILLAASGAELARARGIWVKRRPDHFERHERLIAQETNGER